jgi:predicted site-specific integrase-resolvase
MNVNFRKEWFNWVAKERKRMQRKAKGKSVSHRDAMGHASVSWPKQKAKLKRQVDRAAKKDQKAASSSKAVPTKEDGATSTE